MLNTVTPALEKHPHTLVEGGAPPQVNWARRVSVRPRTPALPPRPSPRRWQMALCWTDTDQVRVSHGVIFDFSNLRSSHCTSYLSAPEIFVGRQPLNGSLPPIARSFKFRV